MVEQKPYRTADIGLASYLLAKGMDFLGCIKTGETNVLGQERMLFVFMDDPSRDELTEAWVTGRAHEKLYEAKRKVLMRALKDPVAE